MTSRERILIALEGGMADRVPISTYELVGYNSRAFENLDPSYGRLMDVIRECTDCLCMWEPRSNATVLESSTQVDMQLEEWREGETLILRKTLQTPGGPLTQTTRRVDNIHTVWQVEHWCKDLEDVERALSIPYRPVSYDFSDYSRIIAEVGENGIVMSSLADPLWLAADLMKTEDYLVWAMFETEHFQRVVDIMHERNMENLRRMLDERVVDLYRICGPEYAVPPFLPPECFRRFVVPYVKEMTALIHSRGGKVRFHCHGKIGEVLEMIAETGPDALDPCEPPPDGDVSLAEVKRRVGDRMCLFGNIEVKHLERGTPEQIEQLVRDCMSAAQSGGGYVIMPTAAPINIPLAPRTEENYLRYIESSLTYGAY